MKPVAVEQVQLGDPDVSAQVTRVKAANPEAIFVQGHSNEATKIIRTIRQLIPGNVTLLGFDQMTTEQVHRGEPAARKNLEGMIYPHRYPRRAVARQGAGIRHEVRRRGTRTPTRCCP